MRNQPARWRIASTRQHALIGVGLLGCLAAGCDQQSSARTTAPSASTPLVAPSAPSVSSAPPFATPQVELKITWDAAQPWRKQSLQRRDMRRAAYTYPKQEGDAEDAELGVYYFGRSVGGRSSGGSVEANLERWSGQFGKQVKDGKTSEKRIGAFDLTLFEVEGTYQPGRPMAPKPPKPGFAMIGAIATVESSGNYYFKLTGPKASVEAARADFMKLLGTLKETSAQ